MVNDLLELNDTALTIDNGKGKLEKWILDDKDNFKLLILSMFKQKRVPGTLKSVQARFDCIPLKSNMPHQIKESLPDSVPAKSESSTEI